MITFEIVSCLSILKSSKTQNITENFVQQSLQENKDQHHKYTDSLKGFKKSMENKGDEHHLIMLLSSMGGTGKSEVIRTFIESLKVIGNFFDWNYNADVIKVSIYIGGAACQIPNRRTLYGTVCQHSSKSIS